MINIGIYTGFKTKNLAKYFFNVQNEDNWKKFLDDINKYEKFFVFGGGTNLLLSKNIYEEVVFVRFNLVGIKQVDKNIFHVKGGERLSNFVKYLNGLGITQLNCLYGIPGTVGGAIVGNTGSFGVEIGSFVRKVKVLDLKTKKYKFLSFKDLNFSYRFSSLKGNYNIVVEEVIFDIVDVNDNDDENKLKDINYYLNRRINHQPKGNTCGSFFKNIVCIKNIGESQNFDLKVCERIINGLQNKEDIKQLEMFIKKGKIPAGWLIEKAGMKGLDIGGVKISEKHANFVINYNNSDSFKILKLANIIKEEVYNRFEVLLDEEIVVF